MSTFTVANRTAAGGRVGAEWDSIARAITDAYGLGDVAYTEHVGHGAVLTSRAIAAGTQRIVVVGGDGTINEAINGYMNVEGGKRGVELALYPLGTGGDLARSLGLAGADRTGFIRAAKTRAVDVGRLVAQTDGGETTRYFLNISSAGATGTIVNRVNSGTKRFGPKAAFVWGTLRGLSAYRNQRVRLRIDNEVEEEMTAAVIAVANGRYFGGGMKVAPNAILDDALLDVCVIGDIGVGTFVRHGAKIYRGEHGVLADVHFFRGRRIDLKALGGEPVLVEADGEVAGHLDASFEAIPKGALVMAPWSMAEAV